MQELFRMEAESQGRVLTAGLLALEREPAAAKQLESCMRAAHSLKGAARIVGLDAGVRVAHAMEDCFVAGQRGEIVLGQKQIDLLLQGVDLLTRIANTPEAEAGQWDGETGDGEKVAEVDTFLAALAAGPDSAAEASPAAEPEQPAPAEQPRRAAADAPESAERFLRVTADNLDRLLGLAGESLVESRWLKPFAESLLRLKRLQADTGRALDDLREMLAVQAANAPALAVLADLQLRVGESGHLLGERLAALETFDSRSTDLAQRLYDATLSCRMRPFADGVRGFPRMVRDLGRDLGRQVRLEITGDDTQVDRDILERLDAPLGHLLRNAVDHGIEPPEERRAAGKPPAGIVHLEARHSAGVLQIIVSDDGRGIDPEGLRRAIVERKLTTEPVAAQLTEAELLEFLFLPSFTMKEKVTEISGRGVGLDAVQNMLKQVRGTIRVSAQPGRGARFQLQLPLTLSVMRTLLVEISGEAYAFPLAYIARTLKLPRDRIEVLEGRQHFRLDGQTVGLVSAAQVLGGAEGGFEGDAPPVIVIGDPGNLYGLVVDRFRGERELVVLPLDGRLGKIKDIQAGALMEDGSPVLIIDTEDMLRSVEKLVSAGTLGKVQRTTAAGAGAAHKRVLIVDDSLTVRELERKLLDQNGYDVETAVDGMDGWNAVRTGHFDLIITDVDMPRMDGIELVRLIKADINLRSLPVMIVSYKDREEDRRRGLDAGADYYLTKGSFHDETLLQAVIDLIGEAGT